MRKKTKKKVLPIIIEKHKKIKPKYSWFPKGLKYREEFCEDIVAHMSEGYSLTSFPSYIYDNHDGFKVSISTIESWLHPESGRKDFITAYAIARSKALEFYEKVLKMHIFGIVPETIKNRIGQKMNAHVLTFVLKTRFHQEYGDRLKVQGVEGGPPINIARRGDNYLENISKEDLEIMYSIITKGAAEQTQNDRAIEANVDEVNVDETADL